jgi:hypothetical protein
MTFSVDDPLTWRVTPEHPIREVDGMDWERCASLHNLITQLGWTGLGNSETEMPRRTWWQANITNEYSRRRVDETFVTIAEAVPPNSIRDTP